MSPRAPGRVLLTTLFGLALLAGYADDVARGDAAWAARAQGAVDGRARPGPVLDSVRAYASALESRPASLPARWKLLRSLHFAATFVPDDATEPRRHLERATRAAETCLDRLAQRAGGGTRLDELDRESLRSRLQSADIPAHDVARLYFWSALVWGSWSRRAGLLGAVQEGVANRLHRYTRVTIALEPGYEAGGAYRLLGRLHAELPRVPFLSGWVDRRRALPLVERAHALAPEHPGNRLLLALTLLERAPERRAEAVELLGRVAALTPRPSAQVEDQVLRDEARARLAELRAQDRDAAA